MTSPKGPNSSITKTTKEINIQQGTQYVEPPVVVHADLLTEAFLKSGLSKIESEAEQSARLESEAADSKLQRFKERWAFVTTKSMQVAGFVAIVGVLAVSISVVFDEQASEEAKSFSERTITAVLGAITGFSIGKSTK